jgi:hypothetical protein
MRQVKIDPVFANKKSKDKRITIRYQEDSDVGLIVDYLINNRENISEFLRELLIVTRGIEVFRQNPTVTSAQLVLLARQSISLLTFYLENIRFYLNCYSEEIARERIIQSKAGESKQELATLNPSDNSTFCLLSSGDEIEPQPNNYVLRNSSENSQYAGFELSSLNNLLPKSEEN